jgi:putative restriction endonuclease
MDAHELWLNKIDNLNPSRKGTPDEAPHKPLLLLVIMDLAERGQLSPGPLPLTPELTFQFCTYWRVVAHRRKQRPDIRMPFHHLKTNGFWEALGDDGEASPHRSVTRAVRIQPEFLAFAADPAAREQARRRLIAGYFEPAERLALYELVGMSVPTEAQIQEDANPKALNEARERGRDARFRLNVVAAYNYTCALTGYRLMTLSAGTIVDAAHIHAFARSRNNDPQNGLALCKNAHWLFDNGLWTIADDYTLLVAAEHFSEDSPEQTSLRAYHGRRLRLPSDARLWPSPVHLAWHRRHKYLNRS